MEYPTPKPNTKTGEGTGKPTREGSVVKALPLLLLVLVAVPVRAADEVIPPGSEALMAEMLGAGQTLPGDCKFAGGSIERTFAAAHYDCADGRKFRLDLRHSSEGPAAAMRTKQFAIVPRGEVPPALLEAVARSVAGGEARFQWAGAPAAASDSQPQQPPPAQTARPLESMNGVSGPLALLFLILVLAAPLAVIAGVVWFYLAALRTRSPAGESLWSPARLRLVGYLAVFLATFALGAILIAPHWGIQIDEERDFMLSALCADGTACPVYGNEMNQLRIKLGPLNRYLLTLCHLVTPDPRFALWTILALHALAAAWLAAVGDRMVGFPFGLFAGVLFGANPILLDTVGAASNGAWSSVFLAGSLAGTLRWISGEPRALLLAVTCLAAAVQLHGTNLALLPPFALAALWWRPPISARAVLQCALIVGALYAPWMFYQWETGGSDFSLISTAWMVSEAPGLLERVGRVVSTLGGVLVAPLTFAGVVLLVMGRGVDAAQRTAGRVVVLLLAVPLVATLLAGGNWVARYGVSMMAPGALAAAVAVRRLASSLGRGRRWRGGYAVAVTVAGLVLAATAALLGDSQRALLRTPRSSLTHLNLAEQIEAIRILGAHGFGAADLESRVHGAAWNRWDGGQVYLGQWLIGAASRAAAGEHVAIVACTHAPEGFASWQQRFSSPGGTPLLLVGYRAQLDPVRVELGGRNGVVWASDRAVPFYGSMAHGGDGQLRLLFDPRLGFPPDFADIQTRLIRDPPQTMRLSTTLAAGRDDRIIVLTYDAGLTARVSFDGAPPRHRLESLGAVVDSARERYLVLAAERAAPVAIEVAIDLPAHAEVPRRVDLYEEPACDAELGS